MLQRRVPAVFNLRRYAAPKLQVSRHFLVSAPPPDVSASTSPRPYGPEGPNLAHLQSIVRSTVHHKHFANNHPKIGQNAKIANLAFFRRGYVLYLWVRRLPQFFADL